MLPLGFSAFLIFGFVLVLIGSSQAGLSRDLGLDLEAFGLLGASLSLGIAVGVFVSGPLVDRFARRPLFLVATLVCAVALASVDRSMGLLRASAHIFGLGLGAGLYETLLNTVTVERFGAAAGRWLSLLHAAPSLGAVLSPPLIGWIGDWVWTFRAGGAAFALLSVVVAAVPLPPPRRAHPTDAPLPPVVGRTLVALCVVAFAYVGLETALTLFAVPYAKEGLGLEGARGRASISALWLGLLASRLLLAAWRRPLGAGFLAATGFAAGLLLIAGSACGLTAVELWIGLVGACLGGVFPIMVDLAGRSAPRSTGLATGIVVGTGAVGGFVVPWLVGLVADRVGVADAIGGLSLACAALAVAAWMVRRESAPG